MNQVAFVNLDGQLEIYSPDSGRQIVGRHNRSFQYPAWSPDGKYIAAVNHDLQEGFVSVIDPTTGTIDQRDLYRSEKQRPFYLYWSPNSQKLAFLAVHPRGGIGLHCASINGGPTQFMGTGQPFFWSWDGSRDSMLVHYGTGNFSAQLRYLNPADTYENVEVAEPGAFQAPGVSSNGSYWAYSTFGNQDSSKLIIEHSQTRKQLSIAHRGAAVFSWSPTAEQLAFISPTQSKDYFYGPLQVIDIGTGRCSQLVDGTVLAFAWSPDGQKIAYFTTIDNDRDPINRIIEEGYAHGRYLPDDTAYNLWLNLCVIDVKSGRKREITPFKPTGNFVNQFLPFFDQYTLSHRIWSPDSSQIVIAVDRDNTPTVVAVPIDGLAPLIIGEGDMAVWQPV
ncbi:MAG: hypothetical protein QNJ45_16435 [Ardenticatenaceae bacterium]|nr:hypothetical protein [Ardenticatenaceae bacterium]